MGAASSRNGLLMFDNIDDPEGEFGVPAPALPAPANAAAAAAMQAALAGAAIGHPAVQAARPAPIRVGAIIQAQVYGIDEEGLEDDPEGLRDLQVGPEVLVVNISQQIRNAEDIVEEVLQFVGKFDGEDELPQQLDEDLDAEEEFLKLQHELDVEGADPKDVKNMLQQVAGAPGGAHTMNSALVAPLPGKTKVVSLMQLITHQEERDESTAVKKRRLAEDEDTTEFSTAGPSSSSSYI